MATTTNFGWETPDDTDLVKDGAAAIRTALGGVDTSFVDLKGGTTGQILTKTSGTDLDFTWATSSSGAMTLLSTTTLSGSSTSISSISQSYKHLFILVDGVRINTSAQAFNVMPNNSTTYYAGVRGVFGSATTYATTNSITNDNWDYDSNNGKLAYWIYDYTNTGTPAPGHKAISYSGVYVPSGQGYFTGGGGVASGSAITSINFSVGTSFGGGTVRIYGVN